MTTVSQRLGLALFTVLAGGLATNVFLLQPPSRGGSEARLEGIDGSDLRTASARPADAPKASGVVPIATTDQAGAQELTRAIQRELKAKGYETGGLDGSPSLVTRGAIMAYEADNGLALTGEPNQGLLQHIVLGSASGLAPAGAAPMSASAQEMVRAVQTALVRNGYPAGEATGQVTTETVRAIRRFEAEQRLKETGRISGELVAKLASVGALDVTASR